MGNGTKRVLQEVDDKASGNPDSKAAKTETEAFNLAYSWVEWLKTGADVKVCSIGDDSNDDIVVTLELALLFQVSEALLTTTTDRRVTTTKSILSGYFSNAWQVTAKRKRLKTKNTA